MHLFGLEINTNLDSQDIEQEYFKKKEIAQRFFNNIRKIEKPFGEPETEWNNFIIVPKSKSYQLRNIPYRLLFEDIYKYKKEQRINDALKCAAMKKTMVY